MTDAALTLLAIAGLGALSGLVAAAAFRLLRTGAEAHLARGAETARERTGDVTGLREAQAVRNRAVSHRRRAAFETVLWLLLLVVPPFTPWTRSVYAACAVLWLLPVRRSPGTAVRAVQGEE